MRLVQFLDRAARDGWRRGRERGDPHVIGGAHRVYDMALEAIRRNVGLAQIAREWQTKEPVNYEEVIAEGRLLPPLDHADAARWLVTGTGLSHLGSAAARDSMHVKLQKAEAELTDSMKIFKWGLEGGKPKPGEMGVQPEWFYKGDGRTLAPPGAPLLLPDFALDGGEEPELAVIYVVGPDGVPWRVGTAMGNEFSDHAMERQNYLYLAHSKLRPCFVRARASGWGHLPADVRGTSRIVRNGQVVWERPFLTGERHMSHSLANLERHHFKYAAFRRPGDVHVHFLGTATLSVADGVDDAAGRPVRDRGRGIRPAAAQSARRATRRLCAGDRARAVTACRAEARSQSREDARSQRGFARVDPASPLGIFAPWRLCVGGLA